MSISSLLFRRSSKQPKGFTLIELVVVIAIMVVITAAVLLKQSRFDSSTLLRSLSYSVALTIRSAQVYGTSVRSVSTTGTAVFAPAYGVYFSNATSYMLFADLNNNGVYDSATDAVVQTYQIGAGFQISKFCGILTGGTRHCSTDASSPITWLNIYFKRPVPDALFKSSTTGETYGGAYIQISAINDPTNTHSVTVSSTGEIAVGIAGS
jgi:prepilin-type N-terminal cleavage/methylation domain-containing protein